MTVESDLRTYLIADTTVQGIIGTRMYPRVLPQGVTYPAIRYYLASVVENRSLSGPGGKERARLTVDSYAETYSQAKALAKAVKARINGLAASVGTGPTTITSVHLDQEFDINEPEAGEVGTAGVFGVHQDFIVAHTNV
jgi:hypothetical protein